MPLPPQDAGKSLLSFILREGALVQPGGLRTAIESVCAHLSASVGDFDLLPKVRSATRVVCGLSCDDSELTSVPPLRFRCDSLCNCSTSSTAA